MMAEVGRDERLRLRGVVARAREPGNYAASGWVALWSGIFGFGAALWAWSTIDFEYRNPYGIVSRISIAEYPKQQDGAGYLFAFTLVVTAVTAGWWAWCAEARTWLQRWNLPGAMTDAALRRAAWPFLGLGIAAFGIATGNWSASALLLWPLGASTLIAVLLLWVFPLSDHRRISSTGSGSQASENPTLGTTWPVLPKAVGKLVLVAVIPVLLYGWLYDGYLIHYRIDLHHEGELLGPWQAVRDGAVPYRDLYLQHGLFQNLGKAWLAELGYGVSLASLRMTEAWIAPLGQVALYFVGLAVFRSWLSAILLVLITSVANIPVIDRQTFGLLAIAALSLALRHHLPPAGHTASQRPQTAATLVATAGACTTLAFFYSAEIGIFTLAACGGLLLVRASTDFQAERRPRWIPLLVYVAAVSVSLVPFLLALWSADALTAFFRNTWQQIAYQNIQWGRPFPPLDAALRSWRSPSDAAELVLGKWFQWYLPVIVSLVAAGCLTLRCNRGGFWRNSRNAVWLLTLFAAIIYFASALGRADHHHLKSASLFMWVWVGIGMEETLLRSRVRLKGVGGVAGGLRRWLPPLVFASVASIYLGAVHHPVSAWQERFDRITTARFLPREVPASWGRLGTIRIDDRQFTRLREVVSFIHENTQPRETIFDFSSQPAYYFLANRRNPTRFSLTAYASTPALQREVIADLEREQTPLVIYRSNTYLDRLDTVPSARRNTLIESYLRKHYKAATEIDGTVILLRAEKLSRAESS